MKAINSFLLLVNNDNKNDFEKTRQHLQRRIYTFKEFDIKIQNSFTGSIHTHNPQLNILEEILTSIPPLNATEYLKEFRFYIPVFLSIPEHKEDFRFSDRSYHEIFENSMVGNAIEDSNKVILYFHAGHCANACFGCLNVVSGAYTAFTMEHMLSGYDRNEIKYHLSSSIEPEYPDDRSMIMNRINELMEDRTNLSNQHDVSELCQTNTFMFYEFVI